MTERDDGAAANGASQDLIEVRLKRAADVAPVRIVTDYAMSSTSTPIRSVMLEACAEIERLRALLSARKEST